MIRKVDMDKSDNDSMFKSDDVKIYMMIEMTSNDLVSMDE